MELIGVDHKKENPMKITVGMFFRILLGVVFYSAYAVYLLSGKNLDASLTMALIIFTLIYPIVVSGGEPSRTE